jgi:hypothetical protein
MRRTPHPGEAQQQQQQQWAHLLCLLPTMPLHK